MHQQHVFKTLRQRQVCQKAAAMRWQLLIGPGSGHGTQAAFGLRRGDGHGVVVALQHAGTLAVPLHDALDNRQWVAAIAHQVAQHGPALRALASGVVGAGVQCLNVGVDVRKQSPFHSCLR